MSSGNGDSSNGNGGERVVVDPFTWLAGNTKGRFEHELTSRCIAFVGRNRRGKTARLDAIRLALTGKHPVGPHGTDLFQLAPEAALTLSATLRGANAATSFVVEVEGGKPRKPPEKPDRTGALKVLEAMPGSDRLFENMLPTLSMRELIKGATLTREAVFRRFGEITSLPVPRGLDAEQLAAWTKAQSEVQSARAIDTAQVLSEMSAYFRKQKLEKGRDIKALEKLLKEREAALAPAAAGAEELPQLKERLRSAEAWERSQALRQRKTEIDADAVAYRAKVAPFIKADENRERREHEAQEQAKVHEAAIKALDGQIEAADAKIKKEVFYLTGGEWLTECIHIIAAKADAEGYAACVLCGGRCHVESLRKQVEPRVAARRKQVEQAYAAKEAVARARSAASADYEQWKSGVEAERRKEETAKQGLREEYNRIKSAQDENALALKDVPESYDGPSSADLRARIKGLEDAGTASRQLDAEIAKLRGLTKEQELFKLLEQESARELNVLLTRTAETANATVNKYMPQGFRAQLDIEEAQWMVVGADNRPHGRRVMSGSEFGALMPALAEAWTEGAPARYVLLDDEDLAAFDPDNLNLLLRAFKDACDDGLLTQVFIAWSRPHEIPDDWGQKIYIDAPDTTALKEPPAPDAAVAGGAPMLL